MPFAPGEQVNLRFTGNPDNAVFRFLGQPYTVANGGLEPKRKSALHPTVRMPRQPGKYPYEFESDGEVTATGHLRVTTGEAHRRRSTTPAVPTPTEQAPAGRTRSNVTHGH